MNYDELLEAFKKKAPSGISRITIPEGYTTDEIIDLFVSKLGQWHVGHFVRKAWK